MTEAADKLAFRCGGCAGINRVDAARLADGPTCGRCKAVLDTSGKPIDLSDDELDRLTAASPVPVLVDLWAPWCGPCRIVGPVVEQLATELAGRLITVKVNTDQHARTLQRLGARGIPTFAVFRDGELAGHRSGAMPRPDLEAWVRSLGAL